MKVNVNALVYSAAFEAIAENIRRATQAKTLPLRPNGGIVKIGKARCAINERRAEKARGNPETTTPSIHPGAFPLLWLSGKGDLLAKYVNR